MKGLVAALLVTTTSCAVAVNGVVPTRPNVSAVRASSVAYIGLRDSELHLSAPPDAVLDVLTRRLDARDAHLVGKREARDDSGDMIYWFRSERAPTVRGSVTTDAVGDVTGDVRTYRTGSTFFAITHAAGPSATDLTLIAKPTLEGADLCSDADRILARFGYWCADASVPDDALLPLLRGREEAEAVRGVLAEVERGVTAH